MNEPDDLSHYMSACSRLKAENARLQTEVERQDRENKWQRQSTRSAIARLQKRVVEAQLWSDAIEGRLSEIVEECEGVGEDPSYLFSMFPRDDDGG